MSVDLRFISAKEPTAAKTFTFLLLFALFFWLFWIEDSEVADRKQGEADGYGLQQRSLAGIEPATLQ